MKGLIDALFRRQPVERDIDPLSLQIEAAYLRMKMAQDDYQQVVGEVLAENDRLRHIKQRGRENHAQGHP